MTSGRHGLLKEVTLAYWVLWVGMLLQTVGAVVMSWRRRTAIETVLFLHLNLPEIVAIWVDRGGALICVGAAGWLLWQRGRSLGAASWLIGWFFLWMMCSFVRGGVYLEELTLPAWGMRLILPLSLGWLALGHGKRWHVFQWMGRVGCALTFGAHGLEAWKLHPQFVDLLLAFFVDRLDVQGFTQAHAEAMLFWIAAHDLVVAILIVMPWSRLRGLTWWLAAWGGVTAASRVVQWGLGGGDFTLIRVAHVALPLAMYWSWECVKKERDEEGKS